jgi:hypothetical protein
MTNPKQTWNAPKLQRLVARNAEGGGPVTIADATKNKS